ncbi:MAG TPA: hypothetical protein VLF66_00600 [Thermoanaerobaculia bacterium]|nr:hypothetical protein [Thermoanaerobaculia bacterium]
MTRTLRRRAAALLVAAVLLSTALPAAASPPAWSAAGLLDALTDWLAALWPGGAPGELPTPSRASVGGDDDGSAGPAVGSAGESSDDLTANPQLGGDLDPDG